MMVVKRTNLTTGKLVMLKVSAVVFAMLASCVIIMVMGYNPVQIYYNMIIGSTATKHRIIETVNKTIPLIILSLGIAVAFKMKFWNIGAEGQFYVGAMGATYFALYGVEKFGNYTTPVMLVAAFCMGAIWILIPALLKLKFQTSETLVTLMLNFIAVRWVSYLQYGAWKDPNGNGFPIIARFDKQAVLPKVFGLHVGWIIALVLVVIVYLLLNKSKLGYEISVIGENINTAKYAGINVTKTVIIAAVISGGLCGLTGAIQASAIEKSLSEAMSNQIGFTAIITAWLAKLNPAAIVLVSLLFAMLIQGGAYIQTSLQIPAAVADVIQGVILLFVLGSEFFTEYKLVSMKKLEELAAKG